MSEREITFEVSEELYQKMCEAQVAYAVSSLADFARQAVEEKMYEIEAKAWREGIRELQRQIQRAGGLKALGLGETKEEIIENLRKTRQQIFEEEYAHLY